MNQPPHSYGRRQNFEWRADSRRVQPGRLFAFRWKLLALVRTKIHGDTLYGLVRPC